MIFSAFSDSEHSRKHWKQIRKDDERVKVDLRVYYNARTEGDARALGYRRFQRSKRYSSRATAVTRLAIIPFANVVARLYESSKVF